MDIKQNVKYALEGKFKVDIYNKEGKLIESTDWFNNFITPTGLSYIYKYNFADCFRFLSLGNGTAQNSGNKDGTGPGTTGLSSPIPFVLTNLGYDTSITGYPGVVNPNSWSGALSLQYIGPWGYAVGAGITEELTGPRFYRAWRIPYYQQEGSPTLITGGDLQVQEFSVFPSSGEDPTGRYAFSRVRKPVTIPNGTYAYVSYQLAINLTSNIIQPLTGGTFNTGNADVSFESLQVGEWAKLSGNYRQVYHGLAWIDANGASLVPQYGAIMEPSCTGLHEARFYLSPDNGQFDVSTTGGAQSDESSAYAADGLYGFSHQTPVWRGQANNTYEIDYTFTNTIVPTVYNNTIPTLTAKTLKANIRMGHVGNIQDVIPFAIYDYDVSPSLARNMSPIVDPIDYEYQTYSNATPGVNADATGINPAYPAHGNQALISTRGFNLPITGYPTTGRSRQLIRRHSFMPAQSLGKNTRFGSLVYAFVANGNFTNDFFPTLDCLFYDSSGQYLMSHYREITGLYFTNRGSGIVDAATYTVPALSLPFTHRTFQGPGTGDLYGHPAELGG